jgi:sterol desaturase/sphingolipid hydroxylase (fatty acid hydroxylase superfamily)
MEWLFRLAAFLGVFAIMVSWEARRPRRPLGWPRRERWPTNLGLTLLNILLVRLAVGAVLYTTAVFAAREGIGLLHWLAAPAWPAALVTLLVLDFAVYVQHVLFHALPVLWRLHQVHHADLAFDATTGLRFHPLEIFLSLALKTAVVLLVGGQPWAAVAFEAVLNGASVFNHGNVAIPEPVDRRLRWLVVTPDMHRIHHSTRVPEANSNFGFSVSWWDRLCGTYRADPARGQLGMEIGLADFRDAKELTLPRLLVMPFLKSAGRYTFQAAPALDAPAKP